MTSIRSLSPVTECTKCQTAFESEVRVPKVQPCGHTLCYSCCESLYDSKWKRLKCPECNVVSTVNDVKQLPTNFTALSIVNISATMTSQQQSMKGVVGNFMSQLSEQAKLLSKISERQEKFHNNYCEVKEELGACFDSLINDLEGRRNSLIEEMEGIRLAEMEILYKQKRRVETFLGYINSELQEQDEDKLFDKFRIEMDNIKSFVAGLDQTIKTITFKPLNKGETSILAKQVGGLTVGLDNGKDKKESQKPNVTKNKGKVSKVLRDKSFGCLVDVAVLSNDLLAVTDSKNNSVHLLNKSGSIVTTVGSRGVGKGQFVSPSGICQNSYGDMLVSDKSNNRVHIRSVTGEFKGFFEETVNNVNILDTPVGIACNRMGKVFVCSQGNHCIQTFSEEDGKYLGKIGGPGIGDGLFRKPEFVSISLDGRLFVTDSDNGRITVFSPDGVFLNHIRHHNDSSEFTPKGICLDMQENVFVCGSDAIDVFDPNGKFLFSFPVLRSKAMFKAQPGSIEGFCMDLDMGLVVAGGEDQLVHVFS